MKVLFVQNIEGIAGSEKYFLQLLPALNNKGIQAEFLCVNKPNHKTVADGFCKQLTALKIVVHQVETVSYVRLSLLKSIKKILITGQFDVLHTHLIYADFWSACLKSFFGLKKIITVSTLHGYQEKVYTEYCLNPEKVPHNLYYRIAKFTYKRIDHVYSCSQGLKNFFMAAGIRFKIDPQVIYHGFNYSSISQQGNKENSAKMVYAIPGRLVQRKGHILVLRQLKYISGKIQKFKLFIIGDGPCRAELEDYCKSNNLMEYVEFTGNVNDVRPFINQADIVLIPSYAEGLPLVIFEAMSLAKPVIAFDTIGPSEIIRNEITGYLIQPFDDKKFAEKTIDLSLDLKLIREMGANALLNYKNNFTLDIMTGNTISFYEMCLNSRPF